MTGRPLDRPVGKNEPCDCGSGKLYKFCCISEETRERIIEFEETCPHDGGKLTADVTDHWMNDILAQRRPLIEFVKAQGLFLFSFALTGQDETELLELLKSDALTADHIKAKFRNTVSKDLATLLRTTNEERFESFKRRHHHLTEAMTAHFSGHFNVSVNSFFSLLEGIIREETQQDSADDFVSRLTPSGWDKKLAWEVQESAQNFNRLLNRLYKGRANAREFHRNAVMHGANVDPRTEDESLLLLLCILEVGVFLFFWHSLPDVRIKTDS